MVSKEKAEALGLKPIAKIKGYADAEQAPEWFTTSPSLAVPKAVEKAGLKMDEVEYFELNEAFSVVGIANVQKMGLNPEKVNVNGGAVSLGHPLGCSGARIIVTLVNVLAENCGQSVKKVMQDFDRDYWMNAEEAVAYGIVDEVIIG